jgi:hypothetical protein
MTQRYSMEGDFCVYIVGTKLKKHHKSNTMIFTDIKISCWEDMTLEEL